MAPSLLSFACTYFMVTVSLVWYHCISNMMVSAECNIWFSPAGGVKNETVRSLSLATSTIDVAIYSFSDSTLLSTLITRAQQGVTVRVVMNKPSSQKTTALKLVSAGIPLRYISVIMHHKFALVDCHNSVTSPSCILLSGSQNWSPSADSLYDEDFQRWSNAPTKAMAFNHEFERMWTHSRIYNITMMDDNDDTIDNMEPMMESSSQRREITSHGDNSERNVTLFTSANFEPYLVNDQWSWRPIVVNDSAGAAGSAILELIGRTQHTLEIATTHLRRDDFARALITAVKRGVTVTLVLDQQEAVKDSVAVSLVNYGIDLRFKTYMRTWTAPRALQMHAKFMIADHTEVLTGSFNWSDNSELNTFENLNRHIRGNDTLSIGDAVDIIDRYRTKFMSVSRYSWTNGDMDESRALTSLIANVTAQAGVGPCFFAPIALSWNGINKLFDAYNPTACHK